MTTQAPRGIEYVRLDQVKHAEKNPKGHAEDAIRRAISHHGLGELPLRDDRTGRLVAGHGRHTQLVAMQAEGQDPPDGITVDSDGMWLMPVITGWSSRSDADAKAYLVGSNQITTAGGWDDPGLADLLKDIQDAGLTDLTGFDDDAVTALLDGLDTGNPFGWGGDTHTAEEADDTDATPPDQPVTQVGDVWVLGDRHRLVCGSATDADDVSTLMREEVPGTVLTDPPYGIAIVQGGAVGGVGPVGGKAANPNGKVIRTTEFKPVIGDETTDTARDAFTLVHRMYPKARHVWWGANHYTQSADLPDASCWLVWDKQNDGTNFADAELAWTNHQGAVRIFRHMWNGMLRASERGQRVHPNQKPVALSEWVLERVDPGAARGPVLDVFGGSGSTLLACEVTKRKGRVIELDPAYCDVIARRWQELTGELPFNERLGEPVDLIGRQP